MANVLRPDPVDLLRELEAIHVRDTATRLRKRPFKDDTDPPQHKANGEIDRFHPQVPTNFTKGLPHNRFGIVDEKAFKKFVKFINQERRNRAFGYSDPTGKDVVIGPEGGKFLTTKKAARTWESPLAGHVYSLQGPDADMLTMPPAPKLGSGELSVEMAEVYALALLRDVPFTSIREGKGEAKDIVKALDGFSWFTTRQTDKKAEARRIARLDSEKRFTAQVVCRGSTPGAKKGPYLSQFMLIGNASRGNSEPILSSGVASGGHNTCPILNEKGESATAKDGYIVYGTQLIDQRNTTQIEGKDYLTDWASWIDAQNGANFKGDDVFRKSKRFITTPRDLASYVHFDQLYQAYLNACLILLSYNYDFDRGLPEGKASNVRDAFATFGGPHILSLVTEVASRALKFARRQKFNIHLRARPEAIAGVLTLAQHAEAGKLGAKAKKAANEALKEFKNAKKQSGIDLLGKIVTVNAGLNKNKTAKQMDWIKHDKNCLLPMAFPEGSPMHPSYAAGHATVAGACITILKAFFEMYDAPAKNAKPSLTDETQWQERAFISLYGETAANQAEAIGNIGEPITTGIFAPDETGDHLVQQKGKTNEGLSILGELDKLAANIAIGRDMAGVHYYTDYYESLRMGERMAVGILQEQMLTYPEPVTMRLTTFDGERMMICGTGDGVKSSVKLARFNTKTKKWCKLRYKDWFER